MAYEQWREMYCSSNSYYSLARVETDLKERGYTGSNICQSVSDRIVPVLKTANHKRIDIENYLKGEFSWQNIFRRSKKNLCNYFCDSSHYRICTIYYSVKFISPTVPVIIASDNIK